MNYTTFKQLLLEKVESDYYWLGTDFFNYLYYLNRNKFKTGAFFSKDQLTFVSEASADKQIYEKPEDFPVVLYFNKLELLKFFEITDEEPPTEIVKSVSEFMLDPKKTPNVLKKVWINLDIVDYLLEDDLNNLAPSFDLNKVKDESTYESIRDVIKRKIEVETKNWKDAVNSSNDVDEVNVDYEAG